MIRLTVQLIPKGDESRARTLATMEIANDLTGTEQLGNYRGELHAEYTKTTGPRRGRVSRFDRRRQSVWTSSGRS